ncbi:tumor necrosis factor receptor superfamily member 3-like [Gigantopelta aegis]|uniref:tumor necrosis factor receptor superfamily member 3-like n=1 Tax=Gigantopelta aegis TaxID=1735272 RepID=UPI001B88DB9D|nr:tumor necrosis factor receptor superfamily member 3-like [Gigantopelta aegis]
MLANLLRLLLVLCVWHAIEAQHDESALYSHNGLNCYKCERGEFVKHHCTEDLTSADCSPCPNGTFQLARNQATSCAVCKPSCLVENASPYQPCNATSNLLCRCDEGYWGNAEEGISKHCKLHQVCKHGSVISKNGTHASDVKCEFCQPGTYYVAQNGSHQAYCEMCSNCSSGMVQVSSCNSLHNTVCEPQEQSGLSVGAIAGIVIGVIVVIIIIIIIVVLKFCCCRRRPNGKENGDPGEMQPALSNGEARSENSGDVEPPVGEGRPTGPGADPPLDIIHSSGPAEQPADLESNGPGPTEPPSETAQEEFEESDNILKGDCRREIFKILTEKLSDWNGFFTNLPDEEWQENAVAISEQTEIEVKRNGIFTVKAMIDEVLRKWTQQCPQHVTITAISKALICAGKPDIKLLIQQKYSELRMQ